MIYCIGDSFTFGAELETPDQSAWPILLGKLLNRPVTNLGRRGCGNTRMVKRTIDVAFKDDAELIVIAWAGPFRVEFFHKQPYDLWPGCHAGKDQEPLIRALTLAQNPQFDLWLYRKWLRDIILTQNLLANCNKRYLMMSAWYSWAPLPGTEDLWDKIDFTYFLGHPMNSKNPSYETFGHWFKDASVGPNGHPLELGHERIANEIAKHIRN
jgi:lysophospholipase L1-like esterase